MDESLKCGAQKVDALVDFARVIGRKREAHGLAVGARRRKTGPGLVPHPLLSHEGEKRRRIGSLCERHPNKVSPPGGIPSGDRPEMLRKALVHCVGSRP